MCSTFRRSDYEHVARLDPLSDMLLRRAYEKDITILARRKAQCSGNLEVHVAS